MWLQLLSLSVKSQNVTIQIKATEQYFPMVPYITLHKVVLTFSFVGEILMSGRSSENH